MSRHPESKLGVPQPRCWKLAEQVCNLLGTEDAPLRAVLLHGPPGTGKTRLARSVGAAGRAGVASYQVTLTEETPAVELRGGPLPAADGSGRWVWTDGPAILAWRAGGRLTIDEIGRASGDCLSFLLAIMDDREVAGLTLPNGEHLAPAPGFHVVATMNGEPSELPEALADRFPVRVAIDQPHPTAIAGLPQDLRQPALRSAALEPARRISLRGWSQFARLREVLDEDLAAAAVFGARADEVLDGLRIGRGAQAFEQALPCYYRERRTCRGDGAGIFRDSDGDPVCRGCVVAGKGGGPFRTPDGHPVSADGAVAAAAPSKSRTRRSPRG